jgi:hypothetical protein
LVGLVEEGDVVVFAEAAAFVFTAAVQPGAPHQAAAFTGLEADQAGDRHPAGALAGDLHDRCVAAACPGLGHRWAQHLAGLVLEADPGILGRG